MGADGPFDDEARAATAAWLAEWGRVGPHLEARRVAELRCLSDADAAQVAMELVWPLAPLGPGDDGAGLRPMHQVLQRLAGRP